MKPNKHQGSVRASFSLAVLAALSSSVCMAAPPKGIANNYKGKDFSFSDAFNSKKLNTKKWTYLGRLPASSPGKNFVIFENKGGTKFVTAWGKKGGPGRRGGSGISTLQTRRYGWYEFRWRAIGYPPREQTAYIPAIWGFLRNLGGKERSLNPVPFNALETDPMEIFGFNGATRWKAQAIVWRNGGRRIHNASFYKGRTDYGGWITQGMEYTPRFLRVWRFNSGQNRWRVMKQINFTNKNTGSSIIKNSRTKQYWIIWNAIFEKRIPNRDSFFNVDYFSYYPLK